MQRKRLILSIFVLSVWPQVSCLAELGEHWIGNTPSRLFDRYSFASVVHAGKIWVLGGEYYDGAFYRYRNDVISSTDGADWKQDVAAAPWLGRRGHTSLSFGGNIWVIGGNTEIGYVNDVWFSSDGLNWTSATLSAPWSPRENHASVIFDGKIWVIGGNGSNGDIWYSSNGAD